MKFPLCTPSRQCSIYSSLCHYMGWGVSHTPASLTFRETTLSAHKIRAWVGPTASQHTFEKKISCSSQELDHDSSVVDNLHIMKTHPVFSKTFILFSSSLNTLCQIKVPHIKNLPASTHTKLNNMEANFICGYRNYVQTNQQTCPILEQLPHNVTFWNSCGNV